MKLTGMLLTSIGAIASALMFGQLLRADPPLPDPFRAGTYDTPWGRGQLTLSGPNATLKLADGSVMWGQLSNGNRRIEGRWVRNAENVPPTAGFVKCRERRFIVPTSFSVPGGDIWGHFTATSGTSRENGRAAFALRWAVCSIPVSSTTPDARHSWTATMMDSNLYVAVPNTVAVPSLPYDGPCGAISQTAVAYVDPCLLQPFRPLTVTMRKDIPKGTRRLIYTALSDDTDAVLLAIRNNSVLPRNANGATAYSVGPTVKLKLRGDTGNFTPGGQLCRHRFWAVSLLDGANVEHKGLGIISLNCSGRSDPPLEGRPLERVGKITPRGE